VEASFYSYSQSLAGIEQKACQDQKGVVVGYLVLISVSLMPKNYTCVELLFDFEQC
jgi:hypothetical protein